MGAGPQAAQTAALISDSSRAAILTALMDGKLHPASELAYMARVTPQTASYHLTKMAESKIIMIQKQGRHRYYGIINHEVAEVIETLLLIAPPAEIKSLKHSVEDHNLRAARTCYDHLAGALGVQLRDTMLNQNILREGDAEFVVTSVGEDFFGRFQIDLDSVRKKRRCFSSKCLDWSERRHHLAGALGNAVLKRLFELNWLRRIEGTRALKITDEGKRGLQETLHIDIR